MKSSDFKNLTGWIDYDRDHLPTLTDKQKVAYFTKRLNMTLVKPLRHLYQGISKGDKESAILLYGTCTCCAIEALGKFHNGGSGTGNEPKFKSFLHAYMHADYKNKRIDGTGYDRILWKFFRNGLAHGFAISHGGYEHGSQYFKTKNNAGKKTLIIDPKHFHDDFLKAVSQYIKDLKKAKPSDLIFINFNKVFNDVFIRGN